ncbi:MAG TPA: MBL fold metallo-hydrolase [Solirubrobacter sp.]|jgi:glyoxylase-like metal-dependent hydrolase (beta-lactamase superfamily II)|nr:MBL fold metallo-hydrolase [Solirubrobacter sp.]
MEARWLTVGPVQENTWIARQDGADEALLIDPGDEPDRIKGALEELKIGVAAILITHCHFDHVGAVAEMARSTGARVYCPAGEVRILENINNYTFPGFGPYEPYTPEETVAGGDTLELAGFTIDVISTPGHSPDHVTYSIASEAAIFSGDVLFQGSIGRTDLPGADHATLMRSIATLLDTLPDDTGVLPGHMNPTTLGQERATNPFLRELAAR